MGQVPIFPGRHAQRGVLRLALQPQQVLPLSLTDAFSPTLQLSLSFFLSRELSREGSLERKRDGDLSGAQLCSVVSVVLLEE